MQLSLIGIINDSTPNKGFDFGKSIKYSYAEERNINGRNWKQDSQENTPPMFRDRILLFGLKREMNRAQQHQKKLKFRESPVT